MTDKIPECLRQLPQWVCWRAVERIRRDGSIKIDKIPVNPITGGDAMSNTPSTWTDYDTAMRESVKYSGIGFMFANGYFGVDIDDCEEDIEDYLNGDTDNLIAEFVETLQSYTERSVSGKGIHIICKGTLPEGGRRKGPVEMYQSGRFFTVSKDTITDYVDIKDCTEEIKFLHSKYIGAKVEVERKAVESSISLEDDEVLKLIRDSKQAQAFDMLYSGSWEGLYVSQSDADMALCNILAFWCQRDISQMDRIFRSSGLYRDKWDKRRGARTYGENTLGKAAAECIDVFNPAGEYSVSILDQEDVQMRRYSFDDTGNAERFCNWFGNKVRYSYINKTWYAYNGKKWEVDDTGSVRYKADEILKVMKVERELYSDDEDDKESGAKAFDKHIKYTRSSRGKSNMIKESEHRVSVLPNQFDSKNNLLNTQNGILNLRNGDISTHNWESFMSKVTYSEFTNADCELWKSFLADIFDEDMELIDYIQKAIGYSLTGSISEQCMFILFGNGRNGKSVFTDTISNVLGDYAMNIQPDSLMVKQSSGAANSDIARLAGARFVTSAEPNEGLRLNEGLIKQLTGGDKVTARHLYGKEFEFQPEFKIWMSTNHKPIIRGRDDGIWRRLHLIPFNVQIPEHKVDKNLKHKLVREYPGILNWALEGCMKWQKEGLSKPSAIQQAVDEYKVEMDSVSAFLELCTDKHPLHSVGAGDLYKAYTDWAMENGEYKMSNSKFGKEVGMRFERKRTNKGVVYKGIALKEECVPYGVKWGS